MRTVKKAKGTAVSIPTGLLQGTLVSIVVTITGAALLAWLLSTQHLEEGSIGYGAMGVIALSTILGALTAVGRTQRLRLQISLLAGACYFLSLLAITALFFGGRYQAVGSTFGIIAISSAAVAFLPGKGSGHKKFRGKHHR